MNRAFSYVVILVLFSVLMLAFLVDVAGQANPAIREIDRVRIAEVYRIADKIQNRIWTGWDKSPFGMLLVDDDFEFLIRHPKPSDEFQSIGYDKMLKSDVFVRQRKFQKHFLATFPAFGNGPVIVVGKAENTTEKTSTRWVFVVLHEHFHQLQMSQPTYFDDVNALNLSRGDTSGMWQLNFAFPYQKKEVADKFKSLGGLLLQAYQAKTIRERKMTLRDYLKARHEFAEMLNADDYKYTSFQLWQEGIARYTQYRMAELATRKIRPSKAFRGLKDFTSFKTESERLLTVTLDEIRRIDLAEWQRLAFYPFGGVEGLLLDRVNPKWRNRYLNDKFQIDKHYPQKK